MDTLLPPPRCSDCGLPVGPRGVCENPECPTGRANAKDASPAGASAPDPATGEDAPAASSGWSTGTGVALVTPAAASNAADPAPEPVISAFTGRRVQLDDLVSTQELIEELRQHRKNRWGRLIALAGYPRHGKSKLAEWLAADARTRPGAPWHYRKTASKQVEIYTVPEADGDQILLDIAGEDFKDAGDYTSQLPLLIENFLWPIFPELEGLILVISLPILWRAWNQRATSPGASPPAPSSAQVADYQRTLAQTIDAHRLILKYTKVAHDLERVKAKKPGIRLSREQAPSRDDVDVLFKAAQPLNIPVFVAFSKADLYRTVGHPHGLNAPPFPSDPRRLGVLAGKPSPPIDPTASDPLALGWAHLPTLFEFLSEHVRHFKFDFVQVLKDPKDEPDPEEAYGGEPIYDSKELLGARSAMEFLTCDLWHPQGISTATAFQLSRWLPPGRWSADGVRSALQGRAAEAVSSATGTHQ